MSSLPSLTLKAAMAITGLLMAGWVTVHMLALLTVFAGPALMNGYAHKLRETGLLWPMRAVLGGALLVHVAAAIATTRRTRAARPIAYQYAARAQMAGWASRSMRLGGALLGAYLVYHVAHIYGVGHVDYVPGNVHHNLLAILREPLHALAYLVGTAFVALHLAHGLESALRSLGWFESDKPQKLRRVLRGWAWTVSGGFLLITLGVWAGLA